MKTCKICNRPYIDSCCEAYYKDKSQVFSAEQEALMRQWEEEAREAIARAEGKS